MTRSDQRPDHRKAREKNTTLDRRWRKRRTYQRPDCRKHEDEKRIRPDQIAGMRGQKDNPTSSVGRERKFYPRLTKREHGTKRRLDRRKAGTKKYDPISSVDEKGEPIRYMVTGRRDRGPGCGKARTKKTTPFCRMTRKENEPGTLGEITE
jgi:hypothetical protein